VIHFNKFICRNCHGHFFTWPRCVSATVSKSCSLDGWTFCVQVIYIY